MTSSVSGTVVRPEEQDVRLRTEVEDVVSAGGDEKDAPAQVGY